VKLPCFITKGLDGIAADDPRGRSPYSSNYGLAMALCDVVDPYFKVFIAIPSLLAASSYTWDMASEYSRRLAGVLLSSSSSTATTTREY